MTTSDTIHLDGTQQHSHPISELTILKIIALVLLIFVHSDLISAYPEVMYPTQWFLLSVFFFIGGYLAYGSFQKRGKSLKYFLKTKALALYIPFAVAVVFYLILEAAMGATIEPLQVASQMSMLNIFADLNSVYNWSTLWFIPFFLVFMTITCVLEKYLKSTKKQLLIISTLLLGTTLMWVYSTPLMLDSLFGQYLLVFVFGFYVSKFKLYEKLMNYKMALVAAPVVAFFAVDLSSLFNYNTPLNALIAQVYFNCRSIMLTMGLVLIALLLLRKIKLPVTHLGKQIADHSIFIYLFEPFVSFIISSYMLTQGSSFQANNIIFWLNQAMRITVLLGMIPFGFMLWEYRKSIPSPVAFLKEKVFVKTF